MRDTWKLPAQEELLLPDALERVLVEYDGPQIATFTSYEGLLLGVASDDDGGAVRWLAAPITGTELKALALGVVALRDLLVKPTMYVFDRAHEGGISHLWRCVDYHFADLDLPEVGAKLPEAARDHLRSELGLEDFVDSPALWLDSPQLASKGVGFRALSELLSVLQRLWNAIADTFGRDGPRTKGAWSQELVEHAALNLASAGAGSLLLRLNPADGALFDQVAARFEELAAAGDDQAALLRVMQRLGPRAGARYGELLDKLHTHDMQLLSRRSDGCAFISATMAPRVLDALPTGEAAEALGTMPAVGYFVALDTRAGTFQFYDVSAEETYAGAIAPDVLATNDEVAVGSGATYAITLDVYGHATVKRTLTHSYALRQIEERLGDVAHDTGLMLNLENQATMTGVVPPLFGPFQSAEPALATRNVTKSTK